MRALDRVNRFVVTLLGLLLLGIGGYGLLRGAGALGEQQADDPLLTPGLERFVEENRQWFWAVVTGVSLLVALAAARWLKEQLTSSPSLSSLAVATGDGPGRSTLDTAAVSAAVTRDLEDDPDITSARVRVVPAGDAIGLDVRASVTDDGDVHAVRQRIETDVLERARTALGRPDLRATVRLKLGDPSARTVY